jgi:hypothetical protein
MNALISTGERYRGTLPVADHLRPRPHPFRDLERWCCLYARPGTSHHYDIVDYLRVEEAERWPVLGEA